MRKSLTRRAAVVLGLVVASAALARAQEPNRREAGDNTQTRGEETIRGMIAGVTTAGETVVNFQTGRAEAAQAMYLTVIGSPEWGRRDNDANNSKDNDKNKPQARDDQGSAAKRRANVYVLAVPPTAKVRVADGLSNEAIQTASNASLDQVELGDHIQVTFKPINTARGARPNDMKHGRHRTFHGEILAITILPHPSHRDGAQSEPTREPSTSEKSTNPGTDKP
jgi:hypothetical protein